MYPWVQEPPPSNSLCVCDIITKDSSGFNMNCSAALTVITCILAYQYMSLDERTKAALGLTVRYWMRRSKKRILSYWNVGVGRLQCLISRFDSSTASSASSASKASTSPTAPTPLTASTPFTRSTSASPTRPSIPPTL
jgi:hypothetical protein